MAFLAPFTLLGLLLLSLPLAIHLLARRRGRTLDFPSLRFLRETASFKLYPRRVRQPLLLVLRAAAITLLVMGLGRPLLTSRAETPEVVRFILIDASLSMKTRGREEAAKEQARTIVNKLTNNERAAIIAISCEAKVLAELTGDRVRLMEAIDQYQPSGGPVDYVLGFARIKAMLQTERQVAAEADIISDFQLAGLEERSEGIVREASWLQIVNYPVGPGIERNAFLSEEAVRRTERGLELAASEIVSEPEGRSGARVLWTIDASQAVQAGIEWRTEANGQITGRLKVTQPDDFDADDERFFAFAPPREERILLIEDGTDASRYLRAALEAGANDEETANYRLDTRRTLEESAVDLASFSLVVVTLHGAADENYTRALSQYARAGGTVWIFLGRDLDTLSWTELASRDAGSDLPFVSIARRSDDRLRFGAMDTRAPQLRGLENALTALRSVRASESYVLQPRATSDTLIRWNDATPAFISASAGPGKIMLLGTSAERASSELGLSPFLPTLVASIWRATSAPREPPSQTIGNAVYLKVPPETDVRITNGEGHSSMTRARELVRRPISVFSEPGIYRLEFGGQQKHMAFNPPALESERALAGDDALKGHFFTNEAQSSRAIDLSKSREATERSGSTWRYFLGAGFLLMIAELFVTRGRRKTTER